MFLKLVGSMKNILVFHIIIKWFLFINDSVWTVPICLNSVTS